MVRDFTLRGVALQDLHRRETGLFDISFRHGRISHFQRLPDGAAHNLTLTPGFRDAHHHLLHMGLGPKRCDLSGSNSLDEALQILADYAGREQRSGAILWAEKWDESRWPEHRPPRREEIDRVVCDRPVVMRRICGHRAVLNSLAIEEASRHWGDLDPSGQVDEQQAMRLSGIWPATPEELEKALLVAQEAAIAMGITRVAEMGGRGAIDAYTALGKRGMLKIDIELYVGPEEMDRAVALRREGAFAHRRLRLGGIKIFADGSVGARTAALRKPYADVPHTGRLLYSDKEFFKLLDRCLCAELRVAVHAIGDAAIDQVLRQLKRLAETKGPGAPSRVTIEHAEILDEEMLDRVQELATGLSFQPNFIAQWAQPGGLYETALGQERLRWMNPFRSAWDREIPMAFGSDGMPMDPALGLQGATQHPVQEARLTAEEALSVYIGSRYVPGKLWDPQPWWQFGSDGAVLYSGDPLELAGGDLSRVPIVGVLWGGEWILEPPAEPFRSGVIHAE